MLFNSYVFLLVFLPVTFAGFLMLGGGGRGRAALAWLVLTSLVYYGWWEPAYLVLIVGSMVFNYGMGCLMRTYARRSEVLLWLGVVANLALLGYYKYAGFIVQNLDALFHANWTVPSILLPLGISFFTFQQVAYLVDCHRDHERDDGFLDYCLFVTFFPQLIAGPIVHHKEMMPQFARPDVFKLSYENLAVGFTMFTIGLCKKVVFADSLAGYASPVFQAAENHLPLSMLEAWGGALAYTFQLYFDFSGYSDMAIGLGRMFGIVLPQNFNSPYKARNIIEFWRRWHMTLSRFLRDHIYIPLGGNRQGESRRLTNMFITMLLGGLWHGAGWTFVAWGALHGVYLIVNHAWQSRGGIPEPSRGNRILCQGATFLAVLAGWVMFRAGSFSGAMEIYNSMLGTHGLHLSKYSANSLVKWNNGYGWIAASCVIVWLMPNSQQFMRMHRPTLESAELDRDTWAGRKLVHTLNLGWCVATGIVAAYAIICISRGGEFLYFNF